MYKIIGADQKEYGPVPAEQVRKWIAEGRANAQTRARAEQSDDWKPLSDIPEFAGALAALASVALSIPPKTAAWDADRLAAEIIASDYRVDMGDCFSRSWNLVKDNFWVLAGATAIALVISAAAGFIPVLGVPAAVVLAFVLQGGLHRLFLQRLRDKPAEIGEVFAGFSLAFVPLLLAGITAHLLIAIGFALCILPGVYLLVAWRMFVPLLIIDKGLEFWPAMELSRKVVTRHWWRCFGLFLLAWLVGFLGLLACGVGIFFTVPIAVGALVYAYEDIFGARAPMGGMIAPAGPAPTPATPSEPTLSPPAQEGSSSSAPSPAAPSAPSPTAESDRSPGAAPPTSQA